MASKGLTLTQSQAQSAADLLRDWLEVETPTLTQRWAFRAAGEVAAAYVQLATFSGDRKGATWGKQLLRDLTLQIGAESYGQPADTLSNGSPNTSEQASKQSAIGSKGSRSHGAEQP